MYRVVFEGPTERAGEFSEPQRLLIAAEALGIEIKHRCCGHARCGTCLLSITEGTENLEPAQEPEARLLAILRAGTDKRLACQARAHGDVRCCLT